MEDKLMKTLVQIFFLLVLSLTTVTAAKSKGQPEDNRKGKLSAKVDVMQIPFNTIEGKATSLDAYKGKVILIVNVASKCGYTPQYKGLEQLFEKYKNKGFVILGFPANNFRNQEPGTDQEIQKFCTTTYNVTFPMMSKVSVVGNDMHPLFNYLTEKSPLPGPIKWNFSKFLVDKQGFLVSRYPSEVEPLDSNLVAKVEELLK
jgi:glutathione peroxidase